jgi:hypothetical protein
MTQELKPFERCFICNHLHEKDGECNPKVLAAIDGAFKREDAPPRQHTVGERLSQGFYLMSGPSGEFYE